MRSRRTPEWCGGFCRRDRSAFFQPSPHPLRPKDEIARMGGASQLAPVERMASVEYGSEAELLAACRRQDIRAFEQLYQAHGPRLKWSPSISWATARTPKTRCRRRSSSCTAAIGGFQGQSSIGTWLCRIVINVCYDLARKRQREAEPPGDEHAAPASQIGLKVALDDAHAADQSAASHGVPAVRGGRYAAFGDRVDSG